MPDETPIQKLADHALKFFEVKKSGEGRDERTWYTLKNRRPEWLFDMAYKVHDNGDWLPDDYKYEYIVEALNHLSEGMNPDEPELEADVYNSDLLKWFSSHGNRTYIVDDAVKEHGWNEDGGIISALSLGQWREKEEVFRIVVGALEARLQEIEDGVEEVFKKRDKGDAGVLDWNP